MNDVGEPCAGEPHARFDGRALETGWPGWPSAGPRLVHDAPFGLVGTQSADQSLPRQRSTLPNSRKMDRRSPPCKECARSAQGMNVTRDQISCRRCSSTTCPRRSKRSPRTKERPSSSMSKALVVFMNPPAEKLLGVDADDMVGEFVETPGPREEALGSSGLPARVFRRTSRARDGPGPVPEAERPDGTIVPVSGDARARSGGRRPVRGRPPHRPEPGEEATPDGSTVRRAA